MNSNSSQSYAWLSLSDAHNSMFIQSSAALNVCQLTGLINL